MMLSGRMNIKRMYLTIIRLIQLPCKGTPIMLTSSVMEITKTTRIVKKEAVDTLRVNLGLPGIDPDQVEVEAPEKGAPGDTPLTSVTSTLTLSPRSMYPS